MKVPRWEINSLDGKVGEKNREDLPCSDIGCPDRFKTIEEAQADRPNNFVFWTVIGIVSSVLIGSFVYTYNVVGKLTDNFDALQKIVITDTAHITALQNNNGEMKDLRIDIGKIKEDIGDVREAIISRDAQYLKRRSAK